MDIKLAATYLAQGYSQAKVCTIVGCSPSTLSEIIRTPAFQEIYEPLKLEHASTRIEAKYNKLEEQALNKISEEIGFAEIPMLTKVLDSINKFRQAKLPQIANGMTNNGIINLTRQVVLQLPAHAKHELVLNERAEIISFGDRSLVPLPSTAVMEIFNNLEAQNEQPNPKAIAESC